MSGFGIQSFVKGTELDVINSFTQIYLLELFYPVGSGSKTYAVPPGKILKAEFVYDSLWIPQWYITIAGNTVSWHGSFSGLTPVFVYAE